MFAWLGQIAGSGIGALLTSVSDSAFKWFAKSKDTKLDEFKTATGVDVAAYQSFLAYDQALTLARIASSNWWGAHLIFLLIAVPVAAHTGLIYLDSTLRFGCGHYGCLGVPDVPPDFRPVRAMVLAYAFGAGAIRSFASIAAPLRK